MHPFDSKRMSQVVSENVQYKKHSMPQVKYNARFKVSAPSALWFE
jgi:hypothetical protein